jgi:hypothetical protein
MLAKISSRNTGGWAEALDALPYRLKHISKLLI